MDPTEQYKSNSINLYAKDSSGSKLSLFDASGDGKFTSVVKNFTLAFSAAGESGASNNHVIHIPQVHTLVSGYAMGVGWALGDLRSSRDTLVAGLAQEVKDRDAAILVESNRASGVESQLQSDLNAEVSRATQVDNNFATALAQEVSARSSADNTNAGNITFESNRAQAAEGVLQSNLDAEVSRAQAAEQSNAGDIANEVSRAQAAESVLQSNLDAVTAADSARFDAVELSVSNLETKHNTELATEVNERTLAVNNLQSQITNILSNIDPASLDSLTEIVDKFNQDGLEYVSRLHALESRLDALTANP